MDIIRYRTQRLVLRSASRDAITGQMMCEAAASNIMQRRIAHCCEKRNIQ
jgi:hypothetical protein